MLCDRGLAKGPGIHTGLGDPQDLRRVKGLAQGWGTCPAIGDLQRVRGLTEVQRTCSAVEDLHTVGGLAQG